MFIDFEKLGWFFAYDKDGKYPIDSSNPIYVKDGSITLYLTHRPQHQPDGSWVEWFVVEGSGENRTTDRFFFRYGTTCYYNNLQSERFMVIAGDKQKTTYNLSFSQIFLEEFFIIDSLNEEVFFQTWPLSDKSIDEIASVANGVYIRAEDYKDKMGGVSRTGDKFVRFDEMPKFVTGMNFDQVFLDQNSMRIDYMPYKQNYIAGFLVKVPNAATEDVVLYEDKIGKIYWNYEDEGVYFQLKPMVGNIEIVKISKSFISPGENLRIAIKKDINEFSFNVNGYVKTVSFNFVDYPEEYVQKDDNLILKVSNSGKDFYNGPPAPRFAPLKNRGNFIAKEDVLKIFPVSENWIFDFSIFSRFAWYSTCSNGLTRRLYDVPITVTIENIQKPFYISAVLNPLRYLTIVKRVSRVVNNEFVYEDTIYVV